MPLIKVNGVELNYEEHGSGDETLVFIHGGGNSARSWQHFWHLLPDNYHCYALDVRAHGKSAHVTEGLTMAQLTDDVYRFSLELGLGKFVYVGVSMGGGIGLQLAVEHSEVLKGSVLIVPMPAHGVNMTPELKQQAAAPRTPEIIRTAFRHMTARPITPEIEERIEISVEDQMLIGEEAQAAGTGGSDNFNVEAGLGEIKVPTLILIGGKDRVIPPDDQWRTVKQIPGAKAIFFEDEGHCMALESPELVVNELTAFIDQL